MSLKCFHSNARSYELIIITETWYTVEPGVLAVSGRKVFFNSLTGKREREGGGIAAKVNRFLYDYN